MLISAGRQDFAYPGDPAENSAALIRVVATASATILYGLIALFINRTAADLPFQFGAATMYTLRELIGISPSHPSVLSGGFGEWFPWSLRGIATSGLLSAAAIWLAPWRQRLSDDRYGRLRASGIVRDWGVDTLAPFTLRADKAHFFFPDDDEAGVADQVLIAYRALRGIALVSGDPIGPAPYVGPAVRAFRADCAAHGWKLAIVGASERYLETYWSLGLRTLYHGEEAILDTETFSLGGGALKSVRQAAHRLDRKGYSAEVVAAGDLRPDERDELVAVEAGWLKGKPRKGFVMELDDLFRLDGDDAVFVIGREHSGEIVGFLQLAVCPASQSLSLSSMPRSHSAPNGLNAFLIVEIVEWARRNEFGAVFLNFSPFARLLDPGASLDGPQRVARGVLLALKRLLNLQLDNLLAFNRHFAPRWQHRYVVYERRRNLARIALVAMAAERYLPFTDLLRGRRWDSGQSSGAGERARPTSGFRDACARPGESRPRPATRYCFGCTSQLEFLRTAHRIGDAAEALAPPPLAAIGSLVSSRAWLVAFGAGWVGWAAYIAALRFAPLSVVQALSASGIGLLALADHRLRARLARRGLLGAGFSVAGLLLVVISLADTTTGRRAGEAVLLSVVGVGVVVAGAVAAAPRRVLGRGAALGAAAGNLLRNR